MRKSNLKWHLVGALLMVALVAPSVFSQQVGDVYMWEFNEGSGTAVTDNSGEYTANIGIAVDPASIPVGEADSPSGAADDRSVRANNGLIADDSATTALALEGGPLTIEAWIKPDELGGNRDIMRYGISYKLGFAGNSFVFTFLGVEDVITDFTVEPDGSWHHVAAAWEPGAGVSFYFDGEMVEYKETTNSGRALQNNLLSIGDSETGTSPLFGLIDRFRIHNAVLEAGDLDSDSAAPKGVLDSTVAAYSFDENEFPYQNSAATDLPAVGLTASVAAESYAQFTADSPTGGEGDFSLNFDGNDRVIFTDQDDIMQFIDEDFTFEAWMKFNAAEQVVSRAVLFAYGIGGQNGYSLSFRIGGEFPAGVADSPSGQAGDRSVSPNSGVIVDDEDAPILDIIDGPITVEAWVKLDEITSYTDIARYGNTYKCGFVPEGNLVWTFLGIEDVISDYVVEPDGGWHHIAYAWETGAGVAFFFDGEQVDYKETTNGNQEVEYNALNIGSDNGGGGVLPGLMDRVRVHNAALGASDLDSDAANVKAPLGDTVVAYNFDEEALPYASATDVDYPAVNRSKGTTITVTTFGIIDAHSEAPIPDDGGWHHIAVAHQVFEEFRFYVDGELKETMPYEGGVRFAEVFDFLIGSESNGGNPYVGLLDRVKITRDALTEDDLDYFQPTALQNWSLF